MRDTLRSFRPLGTVGSIGPFRALQTLDALGLRVLRMRVVALLLGKPSLIFLNVHYGVIESLVVRIFRVILDQALNGLLHRSRLRT
ncbi:MAG: hypothetical protein ACJ8NR_16540 [Sulfurifustis sp.]